jgi:SAM-dependent methyltransferase
MIQQLNHNKGLKIIRGQSLEQQLTEIWYHSLTRFKEKQEPVDFNFKKIVEKHFGKLHSANFTHFLHPYPGKIFAYIPTFILSIPDICPPRGKVLDPFCGSGTVLLESIINPLYKRDAFGIEINPLGRLIAKVKTTPLDVNRLVQIADNLLKKANQHSDVEPVLIPKFKNINFWFSEKVIKKLAKLLFLIEELENDDFKDFFYVCFSSIIRKVSNADPFIPPPVKLKTQKYRNSPTKLAYLERFIKDVEKADVIGLFENKVKVNSKRIESLCKIEEVKDGKVKARIIWDDARCMKKSKLGYKARILRENAEPLPSNSIDLILTSPPYLTAQKYLRTQKLELFWLGLLSEEEFSHLNRNIIGSENTSLKDIELKSLGIESIDSLIKWASAISLQRTANLYKYFFDMELALSEMYRVLKKDRYAVIVVGNNKVLGKYVETYKLLIDLAVSVGFELEAVFRDEIRGRGMITKRHNSGGLIKEEFILLLRK